MWQNETPDIDFAARRKTFLGRIKNAVAVFPAAPESVRNDDVHHPFRQDSNFFYLTGFDEPNSFCLLAPQSKTPFQMFVQPRDRTKEMWEGKRLGPENVKSRLGADAAFSSEPVTAFEEAFLQAISEAETLYYRVGVNPQMDARIFALLYRALRLSRRKGRALWPIKDPNEILSEMRLFKQKAEIDRLARAGHLSAEAHINAMRIAKPGMYEYELEGALYHAFRSAGAGRLGYPSIVASGSNACTLHYHANSRKMNSGDLVLIDAGAEYEYYTADITRTFPVSGLFSEEQREVYGAVLAAQKACIALARPGKTLREIHETAVEVLTEELRRLKVLKGTTASLIKKKAYFPYYPHGTGHWLGMDVHDCGRYYVEPDGEKPRRLEPGMVFTVEPGLYFAPDAPGVPARFRGIGVRIEDDLLITKDGVKVLTSGVPKEIDEVESLCSQS